MKVAPVVHCFPLIRIVVGTTILCGSPMGVNRPCTGMVDSPLAFRMPVQRWGAELHRKPRSLARGECKDVPADATPAKQRRDLARILRCGGTGTDVPRHPYQPDAQIAATASWIVNARDGNTGSRAVQ